MLRDRVTLSEATKLVGRSYSRLYAAARAGDLAYSQPGGARGIIYIEVEELERYMASSSRLNNTEVEALASAFLAARPLPDNAKKLKRK